MSVLILDCETIDIKYNFICDLAWGIVDRNQMHTTKNFIVQEHLTRMASGSFSEPKMAATMAEIANGNATIKPYHEIMAELKADITQAKYVYAYNASFDRDKVIKTCQVLQLTEYAEHFSKTENYEKWRDLWAWASHTILYKKSFLDFCEVHNLVTPKGFCSTSAETCLKYLRNDPEYEEKHTALADIQDEFEIYLTIKKSIKKEFSEICLDDHKENFKGKPFYTIEKLKKAING